MPKNRAIDQNFLVRFLYVHCFYHIYRILTFSNTTDAFSPPRFPLFKKIASKFKEGHRVLFKNILWTFKKEIFEGAVITIIFASFNLVVPQLIKMFMHFMHGHHTEKREVTVASDFIRTLVAVQILRMIFGEHSKRIFHELAIKIQSSLAKKLVIKSLSLNQQARKDIPVSQIIQLENVDLKLIFTMFSNMHLLFQAPFTIIVAIIMLFYESKTYGFIGVYWFLIAFLLHRELDEKMTHCNATKLGLIEKRSKLNYEMLDCIKQAKIIGWEDVMVEKNNDLFEIQNHDHTLFYFYSSFYDIILLMLPVLVVVTICVYDLGQAKPVTVEQVYLMLSLLGICYEPMKSMRTISISFHDGLHSLSRIQQYFGLPERQKDRFRSNEIEEGHVLIAKDTGATYPQTIFEFYLQINYHVEVKPGERLVILGKKGQGRTSVLNMLNGYMKIQSGEVRVNGRIAYLSENFFFFKGKVRENIAFYNDNLSDDDIRNYYKRFGLNQQLKQIGGLEASMDDLNLFTKSQLQKISLIRVLCSDADIYYLDFPFHFLDKEFEEVLEEELKKKQRQRKTIIMVLGNLDSVEPTDKILILDKGISKEYGIYEELIKRKDSELINFYSTVQEKQEVQSTGKPCSKKSYGLPGNKKVIGNPIDVLMGDSKIPLMSVVRAIIEQTDYAKMKMMQKRQKQLKRKNVSFVKFVKEFIFSVPISETIIILLIIACAQLLHVFIHFWIGHLEEEHGENSYLNFRSMIVIEVILTLGLAGVLYYEGQVSSMIAIIQGNTLYKESLQDLVEKDMGWYTTEYSVKIADKFNHDYEEVFIACHSLLGIYKNLIILLVTIRFISSDGLSIFLIFTGISILYFSILWLFRTVERKVIKYFYDYKYQYVRVFQESVEGSDYFQIFKKQDLLIKKTESYYRKLASYKLAEKYSSYGLSIACDFMSVLLLAGAVFYGLEMKVHNNQSNIAMIATEIHLLMNGSQVLKNIVKDSVSFQSFFLINLIPFLNIKHEGKSKQEKQQTEKEKINPTEYDILIQDFCFRQSINEFYDKKMTLQINENEKILILCDDDRFRNLFIYSFTKNYEPLSIDVTQNTAIKIGGENVSDIDPQYLHQIIGVIMPKNFYMSGTLRDNIVRKMNVPDQQVHSLVKYLKINDDIEDYDEMGLDAPIKFEGNKVNNEITRKFALLRIFLRKCKIVFIKDVPPFIGKRSIVAMLEEKLPNCTIVKLSNKIESALDVDRILDVRENRIIEDKFKYQLENPNNVQGLGKLYKAANIEGYKFMNKVSRFRPRKYSPKKY